MNKAAITQNQKGKIQLMYKTCTPETKIKHHREK